VAMVAEVRQSPLCEEVYGAIEGKGATLRPLSGACGGSPRCQVPEATTAQRRPLVRAIIPPGAEQLGCRGGFHGGLHQLVGRP